MDLFTLILLAFSLSADAFAVAVTNGICSYRITKKDVLTTAFTFGFFQGLMPVLGYLLGKAFSEVIENYQHWVALFLLGAIGISMLTEAIKERKSPDNAYIASNIFSLKNLFSQGIATSIDALAAGVSFAALRTNLIAAALIIGFITFVLCGIGIVIGRKFGSLLGQRARFIGGFILIGIGLKIFLQNQFMTLY